MKFNKIIFVIFILVGAFLCPKIYCQTPQQLRILNNYEGLPFENGKTIISEINFVGFDDNTECLKALRENRTTFEVGDYFFGAKISKAVKTIRQCLSEKGYDKAEIVALGEKHSTNQMKLTFSVKLGALARVLDIHFEGNVNITNEELVADAKRCIGEGWKIFDARKYEYITGKCSRQFMASKGYFKATIRKVLYQPVENGNVVTIEVEEGTRYKIGKIEIEGLSVFSKEKFLEMFGQKTGDVPNAKDMRDFLYEKLDLLYKNIGYLQFMAEPEPEYIEPKTIGEDGIINLKIIIDEGRQFRLRKAEIIGVTQKEAEKLRRMLVIRDGGIYVFSNVNDWVDRINKLNKFRFIDFDKDIEIRTDESNNVYLVLKINPK